MLDRIMSSKIIEYLIEKGGFSKEQLSESMDISVKKINDILNHQASLNRKQLDQFIKEHHIKMWDFIEEIIPSENIPENIKKKLEICKILSKKAKEEKE